MTDRPKRLLIVEDQRIIAADLEDTLRRLGYDVVGHAPTGEEAVKKAENLAPDLVLMDIRLRGAMDGIEAAQIVRARFDLPVVYLTAYADEETIRRARVTGPLGYIVKPFNERELRAAIEIAFYKHDVDRELAKERARREVAEESRLLIESVRDYAIFRLDTGGRVRSWSAGAARIEGHEASEVIGEPFSIFFVPEDVEAGRPAMLLEQARNAGRAEQEGWRLRGRATKYWANVVVTALRDGEVLRGYAVVVRDMTDRWRAEETLREADRQKDGFIAMLGHELRNPLAAIRTATEALEAATHDFELRRRAQSVLERQTLHMAKLVDGLLDVSRIVGGKISIDRERIDLGGIIEDVVADHLPQIEAKGLSLGRDLGDAPLWIEGDRVRIAQVFDNLLANAIRFTGPGGEITLSAGRDGEEIAVTVSDSGCGIDPDLLPYVFEPFRQAAQSIDRAAGGLGLGLAIVKGVVALHGGTVKAESAGPGRGAALTVRLPVSGREVADPGAARAHPPTRSSRMLIVEDNVDAADLLSDLLRALGHDVAVAYDGESAVETAKRFAPEVVLCDIGLPGGMNGYDVARALREDPTTQRSLLVAVTGYGRPEDASHAAEAGFDAHLTKPADIASIQRLLPRQNASAG